MDSLWHRLLFLMQDALPTPPTAPSSPWDTWPFGRGYSDGLWPNLARVGLVLVIFVFICLVLRKLYGPQGIWRDHELDAEYEARKAQALRQLEARRERGEITEQEFQWRKDQL